MTGPEVIYCLAEFGQQFRVGLALQRLQDALDDLAQARSLGDQNDH